MFTVWIILSVIASLVSFTALGRGFDFPPAPPPLAMFWSVSLFSLKNFSILSLSLIILSVIIYRLSCESVTPRRSVFADEFDPYLFPPSFSPVVSSPGCIMFGICTFFRFCYTVFGLLPVSCPKNWMVWLACASSSVRSLFSLLSSSINRIFGSSFFTGLFEM